MSSWSLVLAVALFSLILLGCKKEEAIGNRPPSPVHVSIVEVSSDYARISWGAAQDPDKDFLYYAVSLEGKDVINNLTGVDTITLNNLVPGKSYTGAVTVSDRKNDPVEVPFEFSTGPNQSPAPFTVTVTEIGQTYAVITWDKIQDPEADSIFITVTLNDVPVVIDLRDDQPLRLENLQPSKNYAGTLSATDKMSQPVVVPINFTTRRYMLLFDRLITQYNAEYIQAFTLCKTSDKGYAVAAASSPDQNGYGLFVMKVDSAGIEQWHSRFEGHYDAAWDGVISQTSDQGFIVADQGSLTKLDASGNLQWRHMSITFQFYNSVLETADGYLAIGFQGGATTQGEITKFDASGNQLWTYQFNPADPITMTTCNQIARTSGGDYIIAGTHQLPDDSFELATARIDGSGNLQWIKTHPSGLQTFYMTVKIQNAGSDFIIGSTSLGFTDNARMTKITSDGVVVWDNRFSWSPYETRCRGIVALADGGFVFAGGDSDADHYSKAFLVKLNSAGEFVWKKDFKSKEMDYTWIFRGLVQPADGGFAMVGFKGFIYNGTDQGLWLLKTDENGELQY